MASLKSFGTFANLFENKAQAEKIMREKGVSLDDEDYVNLKNVLAENQNIGYLGLFVRLIYQGGARYEDIYMLYDDIKELRPYLKDLPQDLLTYASLTHLYHDLSGLRIGITIRKYVKKNIYNKALKNSLLSIVTDADRSSELAQEIKQLEDLGETAVNGFLRKTKKYDTVDKFLSGIKVFVANLKTGHTFKAVTEKIEQVPDDLVVRISDEKRRLIVMQVLSFRASQLLGSSSWCIANDPHHFHEYTRHNAQYFIFNFNLPATHPLSVIGVTLKADNTLRVAHDRFDYRVTKPLKKLLAKCNIEFLEEQIIELTTRQRLETKFEKPAGIMGVYEYARTRAEEKNGKIDFSAHIREAQKQMEQTHSAWTDASAIVLSGKSLDLLLNKMQAFTVCIRPYDWEQILVRGYDSDSDGDDDDDNTYDDDYDDGMGRPTYRSWFSEDFDTDEEINAALNKHCTMLVENPKGGTVVQDLNLMPAALHQYHNYLISGKRLKDDSARRDWEEQFVDENGNEVEWVFAQERVDAYVKALRDMYQKHYKLLKVETRNAILEILKEHGDNTNKTVVAAKKRTETDLTEYEFNNAQKNNLALKPYIQQKINKLIKGEDVEINPAEIRFAIENGYKNLFIKCYTKLLQDPTYTIDYEDARILQLLGMADAGGAMLAQRLKDADGDTYIFNSIEHSIYDIYRRKQGGATAAPTTT